MRSLFQVHMEIIFCALIPVCWLWLEATEEQLMSDLRDTHNCSFSQRKILKMPWMTILKLRKFSGSEQSMSQSILRFSKQHFVIELLSLDRKLLAQNAKRDENKQKIEVEEVIKSRQGTPKLVKTVIQVWINRCSVVTHPKLHISLSSQWLTDG